MSPIDFASPWKRYHFIWIGSLLTFILITAATVTAHNVTIFAWVEGEIVYTESKFSGGRKAKDAPIEVYDASGAKLLSGRTDENGEFSFKLPKKEELKIVLAAGMGHGNEWVLTAEDIAEAQSESSASASESEPVAPANAVTAPDPLPTAEINVVEPDLQATLEKTLDKKLAPILKKLSHLEAKQTEGPGITEIIGGIGYIIGLMGLAAFIHFKRKSNGPVR